MRGAQLQRGIWQITLIAMLLALAGDLNGVRDWLKSPVANSASKAKANVVVMVVEGQLIEDQFASTPATEIVGPALAMPLQKPTLWQRGRLGPCGSVWE